MVGVFLLLLGAIGFLIAWVVIERLILERDQPTSHEPVNPPYSTLEEWFAHTDENGEPKNGGSEHGTAS